MKKLLSIFFIFCSFAAAAQNWQCLQSGVKRFYINGDHYLRGMRIDSVRTSGSDVIYYPFHTQRRYPVYGDCKKTDNTTSDDASFEKEIKVAISLLPSAVKEKALKNNAFITVVRDSKMVRIHPDQSTKVIGKIRKVTAKVKIQKVMSLS